MIAAVNVDPAVHTQTVEWLFVLVPVIGLLLVCGWLVAAGESAGRRGIAVPFARAGATLRRVSGLPGWCIGGIWMGQWALLVAGLGFYWDVAWHIDFGRDRELFTVPHTLILLGLLGVGATGVVVIALATVERAATGWRLGRLHIPYASAPLLACGGGAVAGFPLDDLWHRNYGIDVTMWGPTHLMMIGGGALAGTALWLLYAEAGPDAGHRRGRRALRRTLAAGLVLSLSVYQLEFDLGVPQWQALYQPVLITLATGLGLVAARVALGRGWALIVAANFVISRAVVTLVIGPGLKHDMPHFPLYIGIAVAVEAAFAVAAHRRLGVTATAVLAGTFIGTAGLATEWGFSHLWGLEPWQLSLFPGIWAAAAIAVAAAVVGMAMGRVLSHRPVDISRTALLAAGAAVPLLLAVPLPRDSMPLTAQLQTTPLGPAVQAVNRDGYLTSEQPVSVDLRLQPADAADGADMFRVTAWQGGGFRIVPLLAVGPGHWRSTAPLPTGGTWKSLVFLSRQQLVMAAPVSFPADSEYHQAAIPPVPQRTVTFVPASKWLMREAHGGAAWPAILAYSGLLTVALLWVGMLTLAYTAVSRRFTAPPGRPTGPAEPLRERVLVGRPQYVTR